MRKDCCVIKLTKGAEALVDWDALRLLQYRYWLWDSKGEVRYAMRKERGKSRYLHHDVLGIPSSVRVDHINGDGLDCRQGNLRISTRSQNRRNVVGARKDSSTGFLGVSPLRGKFQAQIHVNGRNKYLGTFDTVELANQARLRAEEELWGIEPRRKKAHEGP